MGVPLDSHFSNDQDTARHTLMTGQQGLATWCLVTHRPTKELFNQHCSRGILLLVFGGVDIF